MRRKLTLLLAAMLLASFTIIPVYATNDPSVADGLNTGQSPTAGTSIDSYQLPQTTPEGDNPGEIVVDGELTGTVTPADVPPPQTSEVYSTPAGDPNQPEEAGNTGLKSILIVGLAAASLILFIAFMGGLFILFRRQRADREEDAEEFEEMAETEEPEDGEEYEEEEPAALKGRKERKRRGGLFGRKKRIAEEEDEGEEEEGEEEEPEEELPRSRRRPGFSADPSSLTMGESEDSARPDTPPVSTGTPGYMGGYPSQQPAPPHTYPEYPPAAPTQSPFQGTPFGGTYQEEEEEDEDFQFRQQMQGGTTPSSPSQYPPYQQQGGSFQRPAAPPPAYPQYGAPPASGQYQTPPGSTSSGSLMDADEDDLC